MSELERFIKEKRNLCLCLEHKQHMWSPAEKFTFAYDGWVDEDQSNVGVSQFSSECRADDDSANYTIASGILSIS